MLNCTPNYKGIFRTAASKKLLPPPQLFIPSEKEEKKS